MKIKQNKISKLPKFKIRAHAIGEIMGELKNVITDVQLAKIAEFDVREKPMTDKMIEAYAELVMKRDAIPELPQTAKTYIMKWVKRELYGRSKNYGFSGNKYTSKGLTQEDENIKYYNPKLKKNEKQFENRWITGEPDSISGDTIYEFKSSWNCYTFPLEYQGNPNKSYEWQCLGYMSLTKLKKAKLNYVLANTPEELIQKEYWREYGINPLDDTQKENYQEFRKDYIYENVSRELRIKEYDIAYNEDKIKQIHERVKMCREYIKTLTI